MRNRFVVGAVTMLFVMLAGCEKSPTISKKEDNCSSPTAEALYSDIFHRNLAKTIQSEGLKDEALARTLSQQISTRLEGVRTTQNDPNSTKKFCEAEVAYVIPSDVLKIAEDARQQMIETFGSMNGYNQTVYDMLQSGGSKLDANVVRSTLAYNVQPTDDKTSLYLKVSSDSDVVTDSIAKILYLKSKATDISQAKQKADAEKVESEANELMASKEHYLLAKQENKNSRDKINAIWKYLSAETQSSLLQEQKAWVADKRVSCGEPNAKAAPTPLSKVEYETAIEQLNCDTEKTKARIEYLNQF